MVKLTYIGENYWGHEAYRDKKGRYYCVVDGLMHTLSPSNDMDGEPECRMPADSYEIVNPMTEKQRLEKEHKFDYMMLGRLKSDINAYLNVEGDCRYRNDHFVDAAKTISEMRKYWARIPDEIKPEWLALEQIEEFEKQYESSKSIC